jgi:redox-sensitive bicupin YhaK (pirin superfamily)
VEARPIRADARVLGATLLAGARVEHELGGLRHASLAPARGIVEVNGHRLAAGDGIAAIDERRLAIVAVEDSKLILVVIA